MQKRVSITRIWNRVINFGTGSGYPVPATNHYFLSYLLLQSFHCIACTAYHHISKTVEASRVHLFDIVTQYRAIFTDDDLLLTSPVGDRPNDSILFHGWVVQKVCLNTDCFMVTDRLSDNVINKPSSGCQMCPPGLTLPHHL